MRQQSLIQSVIVCLAAMVGLIATQSEAAFRLGERRLTGPNVYSMTADLEPCISGDGLSLYFQSERAGTYAVFESRRQTRNHEWGTPEKLPTPVNHSTGTGGPAITYDGLTLYFNSGRPGTLGGAYTDLWMTTRPSLDAPWAEPVNLGAHVNSSVADYAPCISRNELTLYFTSGRSGNYDIYVTTRLTKDDPWGSAQRLEAPINSSSSDGYPTVSADHLTLFFASDRSGGYGDMDIWMSTRPTVDVPWGDPVNLGDYVNTPSYEGMPELSWDGTTLYVVAGYPGSPSGAGDIWEMPILPDVDFNGDYRVDIKDLTLLIESWGQNEPSIDMAPTPLGDGVVDAADLEVLMRYWGKELDDPHLLAHWTLDEAEGAYAANSVNEAQGIVMGNPLWRPESGQIGGCLAFDGIDDMIIGNCSVNPTEGPFSVFAWIKGGAPGQVILSQQTGVNWLQVATDGTLMTALIKTGGRRTGAPLYSETVITDDNWHRIGFVWDGTQRILYVDDIPVALDSQAGLDGSVGSLYIGAGAENQPDSFWCGLIDDVRVYDRAIMLDN